MGFMDTFGSLRDKLRGDTEEEFFDDDYYEEDDDYIEGDDDYYEDEFDDGYDDDYDDDAEEPHGVLGNTHRPEADSVSVYTRSGRPLDSNGSPQTPARSSSYEENAGYVPRATGRSYEGPTSEVRTRAQSAQTTGSLEGAVANPVPLGPVSAPKSRRSSQSSLPPYVLRPVSYEDVQVVIRRVRTKQPVILVLENTRTDTAKRILDFCLGLACGVDGSVEEIDEKSFVIVPAGVSLTSEEISRALIDPNVKR